MRHVVGSNLDGHVTARIAGRRAASRSGYDSEIGALILLGLGLGAGATVSPGPLTSLVATTALERGLGAGIRVAIAPLLTDLPIILLGLLISRLLAPRALAGLAIVGGSFVVYLGLRTIAAARGAQLVVGQAASGSFRDVLRGVAVNAISPNPWIFILTVLDPQLLLAWRRVGPEALAFPIAFYAALVGGKMGIAALFASVRTRLPHHWYPRALTAAGSVLAVFGALLAVQGIRGLSA